MPSTPNTDELAENLARHIRSESAKYMPPPVIVAVVDGRKQYELGWVFARRGDTIVRCVVPPFMDMTDYHSGTEMVLLALPPNPDDATSMYHALSPQFDGTTNSRTVILRGADVRDNNGNSVTDHGNLSGLADDDHSQYHNDARGDARYYQQSEHIDSSSGAGDSGKPIKLDGAGHVDASMINDGDVDHGSTGGLGDDDHSQYALLAGRSGGQTLIGSTDAGEDLTLQSTSNASKGAIILDDAIKIKSSSTLTLAAGATTVTGPYHLIAAQSGTTDDLDTLTASDDRTLVVLQADSGDTITVKDGTGNINLNGGADFELSGDKTLLLFYDGTNWSDIGAGGGGGGGSGGDLTTTTETHTTRTPIYDNTLAAAGTWDVDLTNIGGIDYSTTFDHLEILMMARGDVAAGSDRLELFYNNDQTAGNYIYGAQYGGGAPSDADGNAATWADVPAASADADLFGVVKGIIPLYSGSEKKTSRWETSVPRSAADVYTVDHSHTWESTSAITRIQIRTNNHPTDELDTGSRLIIYGVKDTTLVTDVSGARGTVGAQTADATVANTVTETTLLGTFNGTKTLEADLLTVGKTIRVTCRGHVSTKAASAGTLNIIASLGGTTVCSTSATTMTDNLSNLVFECEVLITCRTTGASGTVVAGGLSLLGDQDVGMVKTSTTTVDTTGTLAVNVTATWGTADVGNTITNQLGLIEELN